MRFTCPRCGRTSASPEDAAQGYCGACHDWTGSPVLRGPHSPPEPAAPPGVLPWSRPDADPLADLQEAARLIEAAGEAWGLGGLPFDYSVVLDLIRADFGQVLPDLAGRSIEVRGELTDAQVRQIQGGSGPDRPPSWIADAAAVWENCKDAARRERSLASLAQEAADAAPQIAPDEHRPDPDTAARWRPQDPGDVVL